MRCICNKIHFAKAAVLDYVRAPCKYYMTLLKVRVDCINLTRSHINEKLSKRIKQNEVILFGLKINLQEVTGWFKT